MEDEIIKTAEVNGIENKTKQNKKENKWNKSWFFEKINKNSQISGKSDKMKREKTQIDNIRNEAEDTTIDPAHIKGISREYHEQLYTHKFDNLGEFFQNQKLS